MIGPDCHVPGCRWPCPTSGVFCKRHWQRLPRRLRGRLCDLWSQGLGDSPAYAQAVWEAARWSDGRVEYPATGPNGGMRRDGPR